MADAPNDQPQPDNPRKRTYAAWLRKRGKVLALFAITALLAIGLLGGLASGHSMSKFQKILDMKELGLTGEQSDQIAGIMTQTRKEMIQLRAAFKVSRIEMGELLTQEQVDQEAVARKAEEIGQSAQQLVQLWTAAAMDVRGILTPEQVKKAKPRLMELLSHGHGGRGFHRGHGHHGRRN